MAATTGQIEHCTLWEK